MESRITTQRASVARIRELMDQATKLSDVVTLEGELSTRQADLESLLARQASLKDRTSLATITLSLSETPVEKAAEDDDPGVVDALAGGWDAFVTMLRWIAGGASAAVLPFAAVARADRAGVAAARPAPAAAPARSRARDDRAGPAAHGRPAPQPAAPRAGRRARASGTEMPGPRSVFA